MKVLLAHPKVPIYGGAERVIVQMCQFMSKNSIPHTLAMPNMPPDMKIDLPPETKLYDGWPSTDLINRHDVVNFHNFPVTLTALWCQKPMLYLCNEPAEMFTTWSRKPIEALNRWLVRSRIQNVVVADKFNASRFFAQYNVMPTVIPYGIDYEYFSQAHNTPDRHKFLILHVGTITPYKNQLASIRAVAAVKHLIPGIELILVGNPSDQTYKEKVENEVRRLNLGGIVKFMPHLSRYELRTLYSIANLVLHPVQSQGGWLTPFEALSTGCPVVASKDLTCSHMVEANKLAVVTTDYPTAILEIYRHYNDHHYNTQRARAWVKDNLTWEQFSRKMVTLMGSIVVTANKNRRG